MQLSIFLICCMVLIGHHRFLWNVFWYETTDSLSVLVFPLSNHWFVQFSCAVFYMKPSMFSVVFVFSKWNRSFFFFSILRMVFIKMKLSIFQLFVFAIWNDFRMFLYLCKWNVRFSQFVLCFPNERIDVYIYLFFHTKPTIL